MYNDVIAVHLKTSLGSSEDAFTWFVVKIHKVMGEAEGSYGLSGEADFQGD